jgi:peptidoglycan/LPS O-acetylase OafA/YrhL
MQFFFGMFMADLCNYVPLQTWSNAHPWTRTILSPTLLILGLFLASYPEDHYEWVAWSTSLHTFSTYILPEGYDVPRFFTGFGLELIALSIYFSPPLKSLLSSNFFLWLGKNSFAVFLIHGTLIRTVLTWCFYGVGLPQSVQVEEGKWIPGPNLTMKGPLVRAFWTPLWFGLLYVLAGVWTRVIDPLCARWTLDIERYVFAENEKARMSPTLPQ